MDNENDMQVINSGIEVEETFDGMFFEEPVATEVASLIEDDNLGELSLEEANNDYEKHQTAEKIAPVVKEVTKQAVSEAVKYQQDKLKVEVSELLQEDVGYRLDKYEKRRRRRDIKDKLGVAVKWIVVIGIIAFIYGTPQLRLKFAILFRDFGELVEGLLNNEEVSSNKLVEDALTGLGEDLNESSMSQGFDIESGEGLSDMGVESLESSESE
ncbi:MAG: hypothetical protein K2M91_01750 [Lachnospiraceae bacterium]|nr:hypothetical protein [Lachnospiraceae bacterium]